MSLASQAVDNTVEKSGISAARMLALTGLTYRQLNYWSNDGAVLRPLRPAGGVGRPARWDPDDVSVARCITGLTRLGIELQVAARIARSRDEDGSARVRLSPHVEIIVQPGAWEEPPA